MTATAHQLEIANIADLPVFELAGKEYSGAYLSMLVRVDPSQPIGESARTPQLISDIGFLLGEAQAASEEAELEYRIWREKEVLKLTNDLSYARKVTGNDDLTKCPSVTAAEGLVRTVRGYKTRYSKKIEAGRIHAYLHAAYKAADARQRAIYSYEHRQGGLTGTPDEVTAPAYSYDGGEFTSLEREVASIPVERTALPAEISQIGPPPPPTAPAEQPQPKAAPPPPPPRNG